MADCSCGAEITGRFCGRCGAPASISSPAAAPAPQPRPPQRDVQPQAQAASTAPKKQGTREAFWILAIAGGVTVLGMVGTVVAVQRMKQAGIDLDLIRSNPLLGLQKATAIGGPDVDLLSTNHLDGSITVRNRKTGAVSTFTFEDGGRGGSTITHRENGRTKRRYFGRYAAARLPSWVPAYPGANAEGGSASVSSGDDGETGSFAFPTRDPAWKVQSFYEGKARDMNMQVETEVRQLTTQIKLTDAATNRTITVIAVRREPGWVSVSYTSK